MSNLFFQDFQDYIKTLCEQNKTVAHGKDGNKSFFRMDGEEALAAIPNNASSPYVVVTAFSGNPVGEGMTKLQQQAELMFLSKASAQKGNRANETERAQQEAYDIMMQFLSRIYADYEEEEDGCAALRYLNPERISFDRVGPMNQYEWGWVLILPFRTGMPKFDDKNWEK